MKTAYLITFRCYGTWLHGDERGSVDEGRNIYGEALIEGNGRLRNFRRSLMNGEQQILDAQRRQCVEKTIQEVASYRGWILHALNIRTNHVHMVVGADAPPEKVMSDCKAYATRRLREQNLLPDATQVWVEHGSTRYLRSFDSFEAACDYVLNQQDYVGQRAEREA